MKLYFFLVVLLRRVIVYDLLMILDVKITCSIKNKVTINQQRIITYKLQSFIKTYSIPTLLYICQ